MKNNKAHDTRKCGVYKNRLYLAWLLLIALFMSACADKDNNNEINVGPHSSSGSFALPDIVKSTAHTLENMRAWIIIDDGQGTSQRETMKITDGQAQFEKIVLVAGVYTITIEFDINLPEVGDVILATATKPTVNLGEGLNPIDFAKQDYHYPDDDNDGVPNYTEIKHDTKPRDPNSKPPISCKVSIGKIDCVNTYVIHLSVIGLKSNGLTLKINDDEPFNVEPGDTFIYPSRFPNGSNYSVSIITQPVSPPQTCAISNGSGSINGADITNIIVNCEAGTHTIGGSVSGLKGSGLALQLNGDTALPINTDGNFTFATPLADGATYEVSISSHPVNLNQTCTLSNASGTLSGADITNIGVECTTITYSIGGTVIGLSGTDNKLVLQNNAADPLEITSNGSFTFAAPVADGNPYDVSIATQPNNPSQTCNITANSGTVKGANINNIVVNCSTDHVVGGTVVGLPDGGLTGNTLILQLNGADDLSITGNGGFTFPVLLPDATAYSVTVAGHPSSPKQTCSITNGEGTINAADVSNVDIQCQSENSYSVGGSITGLLSDGLILQNNGKDDLPITPNASEFSFDTPLPDGDNYNVTIHSQPDPDQHCTVSNGSGTLSGAAVTDIGINCVSLYTIGGTLEGLKGNNLVLQNSNGDKRSINIDESSFSFTTKIPDGDQYEISIQTQPSNLSQTCSVSNGTGTVSGTDVSNVVVSCITNSFSIGGTISNLKGTGLTLQNNGNDPLNPAANEKTFRFTTNVLDGEAYNVTITAQPGNPTQLCTANNNSGTVKGNNVTNINIQCPIDTFSSTILGSETDATRSVVLGDIDKDGDLDMITANRKQTNKLYRNNGSGDFDTSGTALGDETNDTMAAVLGDVDSDGDLDYIAANYGEPNQLYLNDGKGSFTLDTRESQTLGRDADFTTAVALDDVDKDGDLDFVVGNENQTNKLYLNDGKGIFTASENLLSDVDDSRSIALGDVNNDGLLDLIVGNNGQNKLHLNNSGTFASNAIALGSETDETLSIVLDDVNKDGYLDIIAGNNGINKLYLNSGGVDGVLFASSTDIGTETDNTSAITLGDMDRDGDLDLITGNLNQTNKLYRNDGTGQFTTGDTTLDNETDVTYAVVLGDLDKDGDLDLVVGNNGQVNRRYVNNFIVSGSFPFSASVGSETDNTRSVALGDVDKDGDLDLIAGNNRTNKLYLNDGSGMFANIGTAIGSETDTTLSVAMGDVDGDGDLDLATGNRSKTNRLYLNDGSGNFPDSGTAIGTDTDDTWSVVLGDVDRDGDLDLIAGNINGKNKLYLNDGSGKFSDTGTAIGTDTDDTGSVVLGDVDRDGDLDLIAGNVYIEYSSDMKNKLYLNDGNGKFSDSGTSIGTDTDNTRSVVLGDVDGDSDLDLIVGNSRESNKLYLNDGDGKFPDSGTAIGSDTGNTYSVALGDVDGDSDLDLIVGKSSESNKLYLNDGGGKFSDNGTAIDSGTDSTSAVVLGDVDGDDDLDLITGNNGESNKLYLNVPSGNFNNRTQIDLDLDDTRSITLGDVDHDGDLDLVVGNSSGQQDRINKLYLNDGSGIFDKRGTNLGSETDFTSSVVLGDVDGDGDLDLIVGNHGTNKLYFNDGSGKFATSGTAIGSTTQARSIALGDVDRDGDLDLIEGNSGINKIYLNDGNGKFSDNGTKLDSKDTNTYSLALGDIDSDGDLDIVAGNSGHNILYKNNGLGTFSALFLDFNTDSTNATTLGDIDRDGDLDLIVGNTSTVLLYLNDGTGEYGDGIELDMGNGSTSANKVVLGDVDGDGDLDLIQGNGSFSQTTGTNKLYRNNGNGSFTRVSAALGSSRAIILGDVDSDGDLDLITGDDDSNVLYLNN